MARAYAWGNYPEAALRLSKAQINAKTQRGETLYVLDNPKFLTSRYSCNIRVCFPELKPPRNSKKNDATTPVVDTSGAH